MAFPIAYSLLSVIQAEVVALKWPALLTSSPHSSTLTDSRRITLLTEPDGVGGGGPVDERFDPYYKWLGIRPEEQPPNHYRLLGISLFEDDPDVIANAADQRIVHLRTFQLGKHVAASQRLLNEVAAARVCLLNRQKKVEYDEWLRTRLAENSQARGEDGAQDGRPRPIPVAIPIANSNPVSPEPYQGSTAFGPPFLDKRLSPDPIRVRPSFAGRSNPWRSLSIYGLAMGLILVVMCMLWAVLSIGDRPGDPVSGTTPPTTKRSRLVDRRGSKPLRDRKASGDGDASALEDEATTREAMPARLDNDPPANRQLATNEAARVSLDTEARVATGEGSAVVLPDELQEGLMESPTSNASPSTVPSPALSATSPDQQPLPGSVVKASPAAEGTEAIGGTGLGVGGSADVMPDEPQNRKTEQSSDNIAPIDRFEIFGENSLSGRGAVKEELVALAGGTEASERAVAAALEWLAEHQLPDGGWTFAHGIAPKCRNQCGRPGELVKGRLGATGLALLSFLGAGHTHKTGRYKPTVKSGLSFLVKQMQVSPQGGALADAGNMYSHGIASIALCEAYVMTRDKGLRIPAQQAINFICFAQDPLGGGWRYQPRQKGDTSVTGWQLLALKTWEGDATRILPEVFRKASGYLDSVQANDGANYGYTDSGSGSATTAIGLLCRMHLGWKHDHPTLKKGVKWLAMQGPNKSNFYYNYYATQVMWHLGGEEWKKWNAVMRELLVDSQATKGHETGSWCTEGADHCVTSGGRLYCTAMATMILEVYYRHRPIYREPTW